MLWDFHDLDLPKISSSGCFNRSTHFKLVFSFFKKSKSRQRRKPFYSETAFPNTSWFLSVQLYTNKDVAKLKCSEAILLHIFQAWYKNGQSPGHCKFHRGFQSDFFFFIIRKGKLDNRKNIKPTSLSQNRTCYLRICDFFEKVCKVHTFSFYKRIHFPFRQWNTAYPIHSLTQDNFYSFYFSSQDLIYWALELQMPLKPSLFSWIGCEQRILLCVIL